MARKTPGALIVALTVLLVGSTTALPRRAPILPSAPKRSNFVGEATNDLATLMLQGYVDTEKNLVFSPLGYSALLALLAEGAQGDTRAQLSSVLRLPEDRAEVRAAYREVLQRLREKNMVNKPELRNWFYVYKNHTVEPSYRDVLKEYYLTEVKSVARPAEALGFSPLGEIDQSPSQQPQLQQHQTLSPGTDDAVAGAALEEAMTLGAMKEGALIETALQEEETRLVSEKKKNHENKKHESIIEHIRDSEPSKQDEVAAEEAIFQGEQTQEHVRDEPQKEQMQEQIQEQSPVNEQSQDSQSSIKEQMEDDQAPISEQIQDNQTPLKEQIQEQIQQQIQEQVQDEKNEMQSEQMQDQSPIESQMQDEKLPMKEQMQDDSQKEDQEADDQQIMEDQQVAEEGEIMTTSERRKSRGFRQEAEAGAAIGLGAAATPTVAASSSVAGNGLSGNLLGLKGTNGSSTRMLLFNGMYFRGSWAQPFAPLAQPSPFYLSEERKVSVPMMQTRGDFRLGHVAELDADAIELPYEGGRYALLLVVPRPTDGLRGLVADLAGYSLRNLCDSLVRKPAEVVLPCFAVETITRPIPTLSKSGVSAVFSSRDADLSGVASEGGLYVQDLVQLVTLRVDDASSASSHLTSSALESRAEPFERITADKPFLYFVRDVVDNIVMVAGKIVNPDEKPTSYS